MEKYYWIKTNGTIDEITEDKYHMWMFIKTNNHMILRVTKNEIEYSIKGKSLTK